VRAVALQLAEYLNSAARGKGIVNQKKMPVFSQ
jgi:hypothetical protein